MKNTLYQSLVRHKLMYGMERLPLKILALIDAILLFVFDFINAVLAFNRYSALVVILFFGINIFMLFALRQMAKYDPQLIKSYLRSKRYQKYYSARSSVYNEHIRKGNLFMKPINWKG
jgi:type IV secretory pathway TrbD component